MFYLPLWICALCFHHSFCQPVIDLSPFSFSSIYNNPTAHTQALENASKHIDLALQSDGIFLGINHNLGPFSQSSESSKSVFHIAQSLFNLPLIEKREVALGKSDRGSSWLRGYIEMGLESGLAAVFEPKEGYAYGYNWLKQNSSLVQKHGNEMEVDNIWPSRFSAVDEQTLDKLFDINTDLAEAMMTWLMKWINTSVSMDSSSLREGSLISLMRVFHYFPFPSHVHHSENREGAETILGSSPHTDWGLLTIILQDDCGGLQYFKDNEWKDVAADPGLLVVNGGDYLRLISGGRYNSPRHRVLSPRSRERTSFVFFFYPGYNSPLAAAPAPAGSDSSGVSTPGGRSEGSFNTLLATPRGHHEGALHGEGDLRFGPYIVQKWRDVLRSTDGDKNENNNNHQQQQEQEF